MDEACRPPAGMELSEQKSERGGKCSILFLVSSMEGGGAERVAAHLCNRWVENGHQVTLIPTYSQRGGCRYPLDERVRLEYLADHFGSSGSRIWQLLGRLIILRRIVKDARPDVVVSFLTRVNVAAILVTRGLGARVLVSERNNPVFDPANRLVRFLRRVSYRYADLVVVQTSFAEEWTRKKCRTRRVVTIPNPVVLPIAKVEPIVDPSLYVSERRSILLAVGRLVRQKNFSSLVEAFSVLAQRFSDWDMVVLGEGELKAALDNQCAESGLEGRVKFPGRVGNLSDWYEKADLYAMSSLYEGFPNTLLEALAHGLPAVSFDCAAGPGELIVHGSNGLLVPPYRGAKGLAEALAVVMEDPEKRVHMGREAREVTRRFCMERIDEKWASALGNHAEQRV